MNEAVAQAVEFIRQEPGFVLAVAIGAYLFLLILVLFLLVRFSKILKKQARLLRGADGASLERMLLDHADTRLDMEAQLAQARQSGTANADALRFCLQKIGMVRYDAFADVGGEQSFSVALLDAESNGIVLTGFFSRNDMRVYAKPIAGGTSTMALTPEEQKALASARTGNVESLPIEAARPSGARR